MIRKSIQKIGMSSMLLFAAASSATEMDFSQELRSYRLASIRMCAKLQKPADQIDSNALLGKIDSMQTKWASIKARFIDAPPPSYSKDPKWKSYFAEVEDNAGIMRERAVSKRYGRAMQFCGMNCMIFVQMNQTNGIEKLSDQLFLLRKNAKQAMDMANAGNWSGAEKTLAHIQPIEKRVSDAPSRKGLVQESAQKDFASMLAAWAEFKRSISDKDAGKTQTALKKLMGLFAVVYPNFV